MRNRKTPLRSDLPVMRRRLVRWYQRLRRDLPWRRTRDPYRIWVSEVMLQQTRVEAVIPYYRNFLRQFPTVAALAKAPEERVLAAWSGLGYYSRARNLRHAAGRIVAHHQGHFPRDEKSALALRGVGRYTAAAVLSIAYGVPLAVLDGNVARVLSRLRMLKADVRETQGKALLWARAEEFLDASTPGDFNQAMMELGATVCTPSNPGCGECPLQLNCRAHQAGVESQFPPARARVRETVLNLTGALVRDRAGRILLERRPANASWMPDFWEIPTWVAISRSVPENFYSSQLNDLIETSRSLGHVRHSITKYRIEVDVKEAAVVDDSSSRTSSLMEAQRVRWAALSELRQLPVTTITQKAIRLAQAGMKEAR